NDGNLLPQPLPRTSFRLGVAERVDVIIDFTNLRIGDRIFLENRLEQTTGRGPTGKILPQSSATQLLRFDVDRDPPEPDRSRIPARLRELPPIDMREVVATRTWRFERKNGAWAINGKFFNVNEVRATPRKGTAEVWVLQNNSGDWQHPIHIHFEEFRILSRNGVSPPPDEGKTVRFYDDLIRGRIVTVNFMYARCQNICPGMTSNLSMVQRALGDRVGRDIFMSSITLKPEEDTPAVLRSYASTHGVKPGW